MIDVSGLWRNDELVCGEDFVTQITDGIATRPLPSDLVEAAKVALIPLLKSGDVIEPVGYPESVDASVGVWRAGDLIAVQDFRHDQLRGWIPEALHGCEAFFTPS